jgi:hypothetical protein
MFMKITELSSFVLAFLISSIGAVQAGPSKSFKQWDAFCSDVLECSFTNWVESDVVNSFAFLRDGEANAPVDIKVYIGQPLSEKANLIVSIPGVMEKLELAFDTAEKTDGYVLFSDPRIENELLPAMREGTSMLVSVETVEPSFPVEFSLSGATAVMLYLDEVQDRLNKTDALVQKGPEPATGVKSRAVELKSTADLPQAVALAWQNHPDQCNEGIDDQDLIASFGGISIDWDREGNVKHYIIPCGGPGAYNLIYAAFLLDMETGTARNLPFPTMTPDGPSVHNTIINMSWNEKASQLSAFAKARGLGDCGTSSIWVWDGTGIYGNFVLLEQRAKHDCDGIYDDWPLVWPVQ